MFLLKFRIKGLFHCTVPIFTSVSFARWRVRKRAFPPLRQIVNYRCTKDYYPNGRSIGSNTAFQKFTLGEKVSGCPKGVFSGLNQMVNSSFIMTTTQFRYQLDHIRGCSCTSYRGKHFWWVRGRYTIRKRRKQIVKFRYTDGNQKKYDQRRACYGI